MKEKKCKKYIMAATLILVAMALILPAFIPGAAGTFEKGIDTNNAQDLGFSGTIYVLTTPDIHSHIYPMSINDTKSRIGRIGELADTLGEENNDTLYLFAGDLGEGNFYHTYSGIPEAKAYSMAGIDAAVLGNHAFDFSMEPLEYWVTNASYPVLCANIKFSSSVLNETIKDYTIIDTGYVRAGIFGIITPQMEKMETLPDSAVLYDNTTEIAQSVVNKLKEEDVDIIIALTHQFGDEDINLAENVTGIDLIIGGHDHLVWNKTVTSPGGEKTFIVHAGKYGEETDRAVLLFENGSLEDAVAERYQITEDMPDDEAITSLVMPYYEKYSDSLGQPIGWSDVPLYARFSDVRTGESNAGDFITNTIRKNVPGVDIAFINSGSIRGDSIIPAGNLSYLTLNSMLPFENIIVTVKMTGQEIKETLERSASALIAEGDTSPSENRAASGGFLQVSGVMFDINMSAKPFSSNFDEDEVIYYAGDRIENLSVATDKGALPVEPDKTYSVAVNDYMAGGGDGYLTIKNIPDNKKYNTELNLINILAAEIEENSPISPKTDGRIRII